MRALGEQAFVARQFVGCRARARPPARRLSGGQCALCRALWGVPSSGDSPSLEGSSIVMTRLKVAHHSNDFISCNRACAPPPANAGGGQLGFRAMNGLVFYIGLGLGLAAACGLRPFLPLLLAGALAGSSALGVSFSTGAFSFLEADWWLLVVAVAFALSYALQMLLGLAPTIDPSDRSARPDPLAASLAGLSVGAGALLFAGTLAAHSDAPGPVCLAASWLQAWHSAPRGR